MNILSSYITRIPAFKRHLSKLSIYCTTLFTIQISTGIKSETIRHEPYQKKLQIKETKEPCLEAICLENLPSLFQQRLRQLFCAPFVFIVITTCNTTPPTYCFITRCMITIIIHKNTSSTSAPNDSNFLFIFRFFLLFC